jgi:hypothetical protein
MDNDVDKMFLADYNSLEAIFYTFYPGVYFKSRVKPFYIT